MKKNIAPVTIISTFFLLAIAIGIVIIINQGEDVIELAMKDGDHKILAEQNYVRFLTAKSISLVLLLGLYVIGVIVSQRFYSKSKIRYILFWFLLFSVAFSVVNTLLHTIFNPYFKYSIFQSVTWNFVIIDAIPIFIFFLAIGIICLISSIPFVIITNSKEVIGMSIGKLGSKFNTLLYFTHFLIAVVFLFVRTESISLGSIFNVLWAFYYGFIGLLISVTILFAFFNHGRIQTDKFFERVAQSILGSFGILTFHYLLVIIAFGFDFAVTNTLEGIVPLVFIPFIIIYIVNGTIGIGLWRYDFLNLRTSMKLEATSSELALLKSQINPHFLFNSLNSIYGTAIAEQSPKTAEGVEKLSSMMRFMLKENTEDKISLEKEFNYINNYIDLQRLRVDESENTQIDVAINSACEGEITPMLLIPFIENAFKHGISLQDPSWIRIELTCTSETVSLEVENSIHKQALSKKDESGIGLENVKERLKLLYPEKHNLEINTDEKTYFVHLNLTLQ